MERTDTGIVIGSTPFGENAFILNIFTAQSGHTKGMFRPQKDTKGLSQVGTLLTCHWQARLPEHLGNFTLEDGTHYAASLMHEPARLHALCSLCSLLKISLPEHHMYTRLYDASLHLMKSLLTPDWLKNYILWEQVLLEELGFGMDLSACAATGTQENLHYVSPKSGRAVCALAAKPYQEKMLPLPSFLRHALEAASTKELKQGLKITGYFLEKWVLSLHQHPLPTVRRLMAEVA